MPGRSARRMVRRLAVRQTQLLVRKSRKRACAAAQRLPCTARSLSNADKACEALSTQDAQYTWCYSNHTFTPETRSMSYACSTEVRGWGWCQGGHRTRRESRRRRLRPRAWMPGRAMPLLMLQVLQVLGPMPNRGIEVVRAFEHASRGSGMMPAPLPAPQPACRAPTTSPPSARCGRSATPTSRSATSTLPSRKCTRCVRSVRHMEGRHNVWECASAMLGATCHRHAGLTW